MLLDAIDLRVRDVSRSAEFLINGLGCRLTQSHVNFAELVAGDVRIWLSEEAMVEIGDLGGVILHFKVPDVERALATAQAAGAERLLGPMRTDWGTESALLRGPGGITCDLYRDL